MLSLLKRLYANRSVDRGLWTLVELGLGYAAAHFSGQVYFGVSVTSVVFLLKELVATQLEKAGGPVVVPTVPKV